MIRTLWQIIVLLQIIQIKSAFQVIPSTVTTNGQQNASAELSLCENWDNEVESLQAECSWHNHTVKCFGGINNLHHIKPHKLRKTQHVIFCGWPNATFDPINLKHFPRIKTLRIEHSYVVYINNDFPELKHLQSINISWTRLAYTRPTLFRKLPAVKLIDLRWNQLDHIDGPFLLQPTFEELYLTGNPWNCSKNFKWMMNHSKAKRIADRNSLQCTDIRFKNQSILTVMQLKVSLRETCHNNPELKNCSCALSFIALDLDGVLRPMYSINCSNLNFYKLPAAVPENTTSFYATNNQISSIEPLTNAYRSVHDIYLDYNQIQSIDILESDNWLGRFRAFSLKGNKLTKLPVYLLSNALERNHQASALYLSENPWRCECIFTLRFQELLQRHRDILKDGADIRCKYIEGDDNFGNSVLTLKIPDVCNLPTEYKIHPFYLLNGVLATLIVLIVVKLCYDYYHYRRSGRLPWIVTKMP